MKANGKVQVAITLSDAPAWICLRYYPDAHSKLQFTFAIHNKLLHITVTRSFVQYQELCYAL